MRACIAMVVAGSWLVSACNGEARGDRANGARPNDSSALSSSNGAGGDRSKAVARVSVPMKAQAKLTPAEGVELTGHAKLFQQADGVLVVLEVQHAPPGKKGVHVHTRGDCSDIPGQSMGPHLAPKLERHALPSEGADRHLGDLGNIVIDDEGKGRLEIEVGSATLGADESTSFLGRALVVHASEDIGSEAQPAGNSGTPLACGIIHEEGG